MQQHNNIIMIKKAHTIFTGDTLLLLTARILCMPLMLTIAFMVPLFVLFGAIGNQAFADPTLNQIVVYVNKNVITSNEIDEAVKIAINNLKQNKMPIPNLQDLRRQIIEQLIMEQVELDMAAKNGISVTREEIIAQVTAMATHDKLTLDQFNAKLVADGIDKAALFRQIAHQIIIEKLKQRYVDSRVTVSNDEVERVLKSEAFKNRVDYNLSDIIISIAQGANEASIKEKENQAKEAYAQLEQGVPFAEVALKYSNAPNAVNGGLIGARNSATLPALVNNALTGIPKGGFSKIITLPVGFMIFKVNDVHNYKDANALLKQYHVRHILIKVGENNSDKEALARILNIKKLLDKYNGDLSQQSLIFTKLAKQYSEDTSSIKGGDMGFINPEEMVPSFAHAVQTLPLNTISNPVRSPFGYHLIEVLAIRDANDTDDVYAKQIIRQELFENKANLVYNQWLRDIRQMAYIKYNNN